MRIQKKSGGGRETDRETERGKRGRKGGRKEEKKRKKKGSKLGSYSPQAIMRPPWLILCWPLWDGPGPGRPWRTGWEERPQWVLAMAGEVGGVEEEEDKAKEERKGGREEGKTGKEENTVQTTDHFYHQGTQ